jgi:ketopantoate hydroxymethyltransferase
MITPWQKLWIAGIDVILVGDSASNVMAGHETTDYFRPNDIPRVFGS